ncbi:MAG TPA: hypothetical protein VGR09_07215, partial [Gemmatimonadales bacterium]|nr:hypothetical protein [Gemmatimonadales bacterium]
MSLTVVPGGISPGQPYQFFDQPRVYFSFGDVRQAILDAIVSAQGEAAGWNALRYLISTDA